VPAPQTKFCTPLSWLRCSAIVPVVRIYLVGSQPSHPVLPDACGTLSDVLLRVSIADILRTEHLTGTDRGSEAYAMKGYKAH